MVSLVIVGEDIRDAALLVVGTISDKDASLVRLRDRLFPEHALGEFWCLIKASGLANLLVHLLQ